MSTFDNFFSTISENSVRLLQFTDTHLFGDALKQFDGVNTYESLNEVVSLARRDHWEPHAVLMTGDLVHDPKHSSYQLLKGVLEGMRVPVYCLPGNHDSPEMMQDLLPGHNIKLSKQIFLKEWQVILLNSYIPDTHGGSLSGSEIEFLGRCLESHPNNPVLICLHHPPVPIGSPWMDAMALNNPDDFFSVIDKKPNVKCVIWGHIHQLFDSQRNGIRLLGSPSTCIQFQPQREHFCVDEKGPGYRWLVLHDDGSFDTGINRINH